MKKINPVLFIGVFAALYACNKKDRSEFSPLPTTPVSEASYYFKATVDGKTVEYPVKQDGTTSFGSKTNALSGKKGNKHFIYLSATIGNKQKTSDQLAVTVVKSFDHDPLPSDRKSMLVTSIYSFAASNDNDQSFTDGVIVEFTDANGKLWTSAKGPQANSLFTIKSADGNRKTFEATFNCILYDENGASILVSGAAFRGQLPE